MSIESLQDQIKDFAKDIRVNIANVLSPDGHSGLTPQQAHLLALASAYATQSRETVDALVEISQSVLSDADREGAREAAAIMAMNNVYYRTMHMFSDEEFAKGPARLRMTIIGKPSVAKLDFELASLAVSAIGGCKGCVVSHAHEAEKQGITKDGIRSAIRIAAVVQAVARALFIK